MKFPTPENSQYLSLRPYQPLDKSRKEIRLLRVQLERQTVDTVLEAFPEWQKPGSDAFGARMLPADQRHISFITCQLLEGLPITRYQGRYAALSYCAGSPDQTQRIMIDGHFYNAFQNLEHAVECVRSNWDELGGDNDFLLWTDQICINQQDEEEKGHQVAFMRDIYHRAKDVFICLSLPSTIRPSYVDDFKTARKHMKDYSTSNLNQIANQTISIFERNTIANSCGSDHLTIMRALEVLVKQPWWARSWVFQEFLVSSRAYFFYGSTYASWRELAPFLKLFCGLVHDAESRPTTTVDSLRNRLLEGIWRFIWPRADLEQPEDPMLEVSQVTDVTMAGEIDAETLSRVKYVIVSKESWTGSIDFIELLKNCHRFQASDPRDLIYAFIGLADSKDYKHLVEWLRPNYSASNTTPNLLVRLAERLVREDPRLFRLNLDGAITRKRRYSTPRAHLQSWVSDWTSPIDPVSMQARTFMSSVATPKLVNYWDPSKEAAKWVDGDPVYDIWGGTIAICGKCVGTLQKIKNDPYSNWREFWIDEGRKLAAATSPKAQVGDTLWRLAGVRGIYVLRYEQPFGNAYSLITEATMYEESPGSIRTWASAMATYFNIGVQSTSIKLV